MKLPTKTMQELFQDSQLSPDNETYIEAMYESFLEDPQSVDPSWRQYFETLKQEMPRSTPEVPHASIREQFAELAKNKHRMVISASPESYQGQQQEAVLDLITAYRRLGHLQAKIDPLEMMKAQQSSDLELSHYGFGEQDLRKSFSVGGFSSLNKDTATLDEIYQGLRRVYCGSIGFEYMHINRNEEVEWIRQRIEQGWARFQPDTKQKKRILDRLIVADGLEKYLGFKYVGQKRFSLEGGDSLIPMLDTIVNESAKSNVREVVIGMAHRGRLNVLCNVVGKPVNDIFDAFEGKGISSKHSGDVKYHLGSSSNVMTEYGPVHMVLAFNPSHLEIVSPVVQGSVRSRQRRRGDTDQQKVVPIQIHGDAAFAGQGVVMETFQMSQARWFKVGGSIHIVINNQVGFTTSNPLDSRSTLYCTDVAKLIEAPILHVNANDPEAVYFASLFAMEYRQQFKRDVVIDLVCYRRHGHNEADEPSATQPLMYKKIKALKVPYQLYANQLISEGVIQDGDEKQAVADYRDKLDQGEAVVPIAEDKHYEYIVNWHPFDGTEWDVKTNTGVPEAQLKGLASKINQLPEGFVLQPQLKKVHQAQEKMASGESGIQWGFAESLAYASLLEEGYPIRLCGQDAGRGTFAHRHAVLHEQNTGEVFIPLSHLSNHQAQINVVDSLLSEEGVLAFEYGYATAEPNFLTIWEAQFGDFANGAQVVIDQFISSGEQKWGRLCGLVMLLPHGYEGQGPEHSSARLERYLQLCAQDNIQVCVPSTPAQIFHLLRRQMIRPYRKPLIVMSPKSLLRHPLAVSGFADLSATGFQLVIPEVDELDAQKVDRVVICSGKVYYELLEQRRKDALSNTAILRLEQLYPFPQEAVKEALKPYQHVKDIVWCQEEPQNQGAWITMQPFITEVLNQDQALSYVGRPTSASPAAGYHSVHVKEQAELIAKALLRRKV